MQLSTSVDFGFTKAQGVWEIQKDDQGKSYIVPSGTTFLRDDKEVTVEFRVYFDPSKTEEDPSKKGRHLLRTGVSLNEAVPFETGTK